jgi:AraC-like DNA-binding protein
MVLLANYRIFETNDLDEGSSFGERNWERNHASRMEGPYGLRWNQADFDRLAFSYVEHDAAVDLTAEGPLSDHFRLYFHKQGSIQHTLNGQQIVSDPDTPVVHAPGIDMMLDIRPFEVLMVSVDGEIVRNGLAQRFGRLPALETWIGALQRSPSVDALESMAIWMCRELERHGSPLAAARKPRMHAERMLIAMFVECLADMAPHENDRPADLGEWQVRQAEAWIDAHARDAIGVEEIARAMGVGVRSLQRSFRRVKGYSPSQAVLQHRLYQTREAFLTAGPDATVTAIAAEFGFFALGRFAQQYRKQFGEYPSETLTRRR